MSLSDSEPDKEEDKQDSLFGSDKWSFLAVLQNFLEACTKAESCSTRLKSRMTLVAHVSVVVRHTHF